MKMDKQIHGKIANIERLMEVKLESMDADINGKLDILLKYNGLEYSPKK